MRFTRLLLPCLLFPLALHAQTFEQLSFVRLTDQTANVRGAGMGNISIEDPALDPTTLSKFDRTSFSVAASRVEFDLMTGFLFSETRNGVGLSHAMFAMPLGDVTIGAHYNASPELRSPRAIRQGGTAAYEPQSCDMTSCWFAPFFGEPMFERTERRYGASVSWERGPLIFGAGAELHELEEAASYGQTVGFSGEAPPEFPPFDLIVRRLEGREIVPHAAIRYNVSDRASIAVAYNGAAEFRSSTDVCRAGDTYPFECESQYQRLGEGTRRTADSFRASVSVDPVDSLTFAAEVVRHNFRNTGKPDDPGTPYQNVYRNALSLHAGAEFRTANLALRAGWWRDPSRWIAGFYDPAFSFGRKQDHVTLGAGMTFGAARVDLAVDDADTPSLRRASIGVTFAAPGS